MPRISFGDRIVPVKNVLIRMKTQDAQPIRTGQPGRADRQGVRQYLIDSLDGGIGIIRGSEVLHNKRYQSSQGLWAHIPGGLFLPYKATTQSHAVNISSLKNANLMVHSVNSTLGGSALRTYLGVGKLLYRNDTASAAIENVSDGNQSSVATTATFTNNITGMFEGRFNSTRYLVVCTDDTTNDVTGIADPTANAPALSTIFAYSAGDWTGGGAYLPNVGPGFNIFYGKVGGTTGLWYLNTTSALATAPKAVVLTESKDVEGSLATSNTGTITAGNGTNLVGSGSESSGGTIDDLFWAGSGNVTANDATYATWSSTAAGQISDALVGHNFSISGPADNDIITGVVVGIEHAQGNAADEYFIYNIRLMVEGGMVGYNHAPGIELTDTVTLDTYGSSSDRWGADLLGRDVKNGNFGACVQYIDTTGAVSNVAVDYMTVNVTYRSPGTQASIPLGGRVLGVDPRFPNTVWIIAPEFQDETSATNVPRILWRCDFDYDVEGNRPTVTLTKVNTGLTNISRAVFTGGTLAGIAVAGNDISGVAKVVNLVTESGVVSLFPHVDATNEAINLTEAWGVSNMWSQGDELIVDMCLEAGTTVQSWLFVNNTWHPIGTRETTSSVPLIWADNPKICETFTSRYRVYPSSTSTAITRVFQPRNYLLDPRYNNTSEVKENGILTITLPELDILGPEESEKVLLKATCLSRTVSVDNTIRLRYSTDGGSSFTTWTTFTAHAQSSTLSTPVEFRTLVLELGLDQQANGGGATTDTPTGLPILIEGTTRWTPQRQFICEVDIDSEEFEHRFPGGLDELWDALSALDPVENLIVATDTVPCTWQDYRFGIVPSDILPALPEEYMAKGDRLLLFEEVVS